MENRSFSQTAALTVRQSGDGAAQRFRMDAPAFPRGRSGLLFLAAALGLTGISAGWIWFGTAAVLPLLYTLPCAAMLAMCMKGHGAGGKAPYKPDVNGGNEPDGSP